jgi:hypothetical protein
MVLDEVPACAGMTMAKKERMVLDEVPACAGISRAGLLRGCYML